MTIWLLALVLLASSGALGYRQGVIRVAFSLVGIFVAALLAAPLAGRVRPALTAIGVHDPVVLWTVGPVVVFVIVLCVFKILGQVAHHKMWLRLKGEADDFRQLMRQRLIHRLGLCLGLVNATVYLALIAFGLYVTAYWTVQLTPPVNIPMGIKIINLLGKDLERTGLARVAKAIDPLPAAYYDAADLAGLVYHTPLLEARLSRYPAFFALAERPEFQALAQDQAFTEMWQRQEPVKSLLTEASVDPIVHNPELLSAIWNTLVPDIDDLRGYLETGRSAKYDSERILGRWAFDVNGALGAYRQAKPSVTSTEMQRVKTLLTAGYARTTLVVAPDHRVFLKDLPLFKAQPGGAPKAELQSLKGQWKSGDRDYEMSFESGGDRRARFEGTRLFLTSEGLTLVFVKEE